MQVGNRGANLVNVAKNVAEVEAEGGNVMKQHLLIVVHALVKEDVGEAILDMEPHRV